MKDDIIVDFKQNKRKIQIIHREWQIHFSFLIDYL